MSRNLYELAISKLKQTTNAAYTRNPYQREEFPLPSEELLRYSGQPAQQFESSFEESLLPPRRIEQQPFTYRRQLPPLPSGELPRQVYAPPPPVSQQSGLAFRPVPYPEMTERRLRMEADIAKQESKIRPRVLRSVKPEEHEEEIRLKGFTIKDIFSRDPSPIELGPEEELIFLSGRIRYDPVLGLPIQSSSSSSGTTTPTFGTSSEQEFERRYEVQPTGPRTERAMAFRESVRREQEARKTMQLRYGGESGEDLRMDPLY